jgi:hypothetical protein
VTPSSLSPVNKNAVVKKSVGITGRKIKSLSTREIKYAERRMMPDRLSSSMIMSSCGTEEVRDGGRREGKEGGRGGGGRREEGRREGEGRGEGGDIHCIMAIL